MCYLDQKEKKSLYGWILRNKRNYWKNEPGRRLSNEQIRKLESLPGWGWHEPNWEFGYLKLKQYYENHGHSIPNAKFITEDEDQFNLGSWVSVNRVKYNKKELHQDKINRLGKLDFAWRLTTNKKVEL